jgi:hypothetical protein
MEVFREMNIYGNDTEQLAALMDEVEKSLPPGWRLSMAGYRSDASLRRISVTEPPYCFEHYQEDSLPSASIYLVEQEPGRLTVSNIRPHNKRQLSYDEYNSILEVFSDIVRPCAKKREVHVELTSCHADLSDWLSKTALEKLRSFSTTASRNTGAALPLDRQRWLDFIVTAHREGSQLDGTMLRRWLIEIEGWDPEIADHLAGEYAFGGKLLSFTEQVGV